MKEHVAKRINSLTVAMVEWMNAETKNTRIASLVFRKDQLQIWVRENDGEKTHADMRVVSWEYIDLVSNDGYLLNRFKEITENMATRVTAK